MAAVSQDRFTVLHSLSFLFQHSGTSHSEVPDDKALVGFAQLSLVDQDPPSPLAAHDVLPPQ